MRYKEQLIKCGRNLTREDFVFFWGHRDRETGNEAVCLSQWYPSPFVEDGQYYNCAEQYLMAGKAGMFSDEDCRSLILSSYDPMAMKKLGRRVRNFNEYVWKMNRCSVAFNGNLAKFSQNEKLSRFLLSTGDRILPIWITIRMWRYSMDCWSVSMGEMPNHIGMPFSADASE